jgi:hypothetical protein
MGNSAQIDQFAELQGNTQEIAERITNAQDPAFLSAPLLSRLILRLAKALKKPSGASKKIGLLDERLIEIAKITRECQFRVPKDVASHYNMLVVAILKQLEQDELFARTNGDRGAAV